MRIAKSLILLSLTCMASTSTFAQDAAVDKEETRDGRLEGVIIQVPHDLPASVMAELTEVFENQEERVPFRIKTIDGTNGIVTHGQRDAVLKADGFAKVVEVHEHHHAPTAPFVAGPPPPFGPGVPTPGHSDVHIDLEHLEHHIQQQMVHRLAIEHRALMKSGKHEDAEEIEQKLREHVQEHVKHQLEAQWKHVRALESRLEKLHERLHEKEEHIERTIDREVEGLLNHFSHLEANVDMDVAVEIPEGMIWHEAQAVRWPAMLKQQAARARRANQASSTETAWKPWTGAPDAEMADKARLAQQEIEIAVQEAHLAEVAKHIEQLAGPERARIALAVESATKANESRLREATKELERVQKELEAAKKALFEAQVESEQKSNGELP